MDERIVLVAPSLLSADFSRMGEAVDRVNASGADWIHIDVMDGSFVPVITFGPKMVADIRPRTALPLDVHLMIERPENHVAAFAEAGADYLTFHVEAVVHAHRLVETIRKLGVRPGISIVPSTPAAAVTELLPFVDQVLLMTVNPGFGGQKLIRECLDKLRALRDLRRDRGLSFLLAADGGINGETASAVREAGADVLITGSAFFSAPDPAREVSALRGFRIA